MARIPHKYVVTNIFDRKETRRRSITAFRIGLNRSRISVPTGAATVATCSLLAAKTHASAQNATSLAMQTVHIWYLISVECQWRLRTSSYGIGVTSIEREAGKHQLHLVSHLLITTNNLTLLWTAYSRLVGAWTDYGSLGLILNMPCLHPHLLLTPMGGSTVTALLKSGFHTISSRHLLHMRNSQRPNSLVDLQLAQNCQQPLDFHRTTLMITPASNQSTVFHNIR